MSIKRNVLLLAAIFMLSSSTIYACGGFTGFTLQGRTFETQNDTNVFVTYRSGEQMIAFEPSYKGNASDFGLVVPLPARPKIMEVRPELFGQLEDLTQSYTSNNSSNDLSVSLGGFGATKSFGVRVIERKDVGDFKTTVLTATSTADLLKWLKDNSYQYHDTDIANFD